MERRNKRNIAIGILCTLLVFMGVGYAALNQVLDINGTARSTNTWSVLIESITKKASSNGVTSTERVGVDNTKSSDNATFSVEFIKPGDYIEYDVVVGNSGTIAGQVSEVNFTTTNTELFTTSFNNSIINKTISPGGSETFTIRIDYNSEATTLATNEEQFQLVLTSIQGEGSNITPESGEEDDWLYKVNSDGLITGFNYDSPYAKVNGNYVANIPAEVDGIPVTSIDEKSFTITSLLVSRDYTKAVVVDKANAAIIEEIGRKVLALKGVSSLTVYEEGTIDTTNFIPIYVDIQRYNNDNGQITPGNAEFVMSADLYNSISISALDLSQATNLTTIGDRAFYHSDLIAVNLGNTVTTIGDWAFYGNQISNLTIPSSVTTIGSGAFNAQRDSTNNYTLSSITIRRTEQDFLTNVTVESNWYDNTLTPTITYNPS